MSLRIVFAGTPDFAVPTLQALIESEHQVRAVYTQPDRPAGRGRRVAASPVKSLALEHQLPVYQPVSLKEEVERLAGLAPDVMVVVAYGLILPRAVLEIPAYGCVNVHASLLPRWRGAAPIQRAIEAGDEQTGVTIMQMDAGLDTGDILATRATPINDSDTAQSLHDRLARMGPGALLEVLEQLPQGSARRVPQDDARATYAAKLSKREARIDWRRPADEIARRIRAFNPWPVATTEYHGVTVRLWEACVVMEPPQGDPGQVLAVDASAIWIAAGQGRVGIQRLQAAGGKAQPAADFANGYRIQAGDMFGG
jgi:methionyl-tRNA formyltransferase